MFSYLLVCSSLLEYEGGQGAPLATTYVPESASLCLPLPDLDVYRRLGHHIEPAQGRFVCMCVLLYYCGCVVVVVVDSVSYIALT